MDCKHCGAPLTEEDQVCTVCGTAAEETAAEELPETAAEETAAEELQETASEVTEETAEETEVSAEEAPAAEEETETKTEQPAPRKNTGLIIALVACIAAIAVLLALLFTGGKNQSADSEPPIIPPEDQTLETSADSTEQDSTEDTTDSDLSDYLVEPYVPAVSYVTDDAAAFDEALLSTVVASCGDSELTNEVLTYYYWREYFTFVNMYSSYITMLMDPYGRLDEQEAITGGKSWDELFMETCLKSYHTYAAASTAGRAAGYEMTQSERDGLDNIPAELQSYAELYGYETSDAYLQVSFGPYASAAGYQTFMEEYIYAASYLEYLLAARGITPENINAYYEEHKDELISVGLEKDDRPMVNIRHILIQPETVTIAQDEAGYEEAVAAALAAAEATANDIYAQWQSGAMDEESFSALAMEYSSDGSAANGGLIESIRPGQTVDNFDAWCFAEGRKAGDHGLVQTEYGYHIIYLSAVQEESYWYQQMKTEYENAIYMEICTGITEQYPLTTDLTRAAVYPVNVDMAGYAQ